MTMNDLRTAIANDTGELPERWNPDDEPDMVLVGTLLGVETLATDLGPARIAHIEDAEDGTVYGLMIERSVLKNRWEQLKPQNGDMVAIKYIGLTPPRVKGKNSYHNYVLRVARAEGTVATAPAATAPADTDDIPF